MYSAILLMAGKGSRMNNDINKVLLPLGNKLVFEHSLEKLLEFVDEVICVISRDDESFIKSRLPKDVKIVYGGETRGESVKNGLEACTGDYVLIHDAARPFVSKEVISNIIANANLDQAILTYLDVKDTIKLKEDKITTLNRDNLVAAVTPQCASVKLLNEVYTRAFNDNLQFTDDISLIEYYYPNIIINLIKSNDENFKITTLIDYELAKVIGDRHD